MPTTDYQATERDLAEMYRGFDLGRKVRGVDAEQRLGEYALAIDTRVTEAGTFVHVELPFGWLECAMTKEGRSWVIDTVRHHSSHYPEHDVITECDGNSFSYRFADDYAEVEVPR